MLPLRTALLVSSIFTFLLIPPPSLIFFCLHQALALETLSHEYICGYRELFVNWDRDEATMFVCIVMDFYEAGRFPSEKIVRRVCVSECEFKCECVFQCV